MYFIDWLFVIVVLILAIHFLGPEFSALTASVASALQSFSGF